MEPIDAASKDDPIRPGSSPIGGLDLSHVGVLAALPGELGPFLIQSEGRPAAEPVRSVQGVEVHSQRLPKGGLQVTSAVSGIGKVAAAHGASALLSCGVEALFMVGTCGGLSPEHAVGDLVHLAGAIQWDLSSRNGREVSAHEGLTEAWRLQTSGGLGWALTADRPALRWISRWRRARAARDWLDERGTPVADMETAAVGAVAQRAGTPWAALRVVSDAQRSLGARILGRNRGASSFEANYRAQAARPATSLWGWLSQ